MRQKESTSVRMNKSWKLSRTVHVAVYTLTFGDVADLVFEVRRAAAPGHVFQVEALI